MDRFPHRIDVVWGWIAAGALLLPACSDGASREDATSCSRWTPCVASDTPSAVRSTNYRRGGSPASSESPVIPAAHLFAPPPLPTVDKSPADAARDSRVFSRRGATVRIAPSVNMTGSDASSPRHLPEVDAAGEDVIRKLPQVEPGILPPHAKLMRIDGGAAADDEENTMYLLPPVLENDAPSDAALVDEQAEDIAVRRLPVLPTEDPPNEAIPQDDTHVRRLPVVPSDTSDVTACPARAATTACWPGQPNS
jgi:hypothetical protein